MKSLKDVTENVAEVESIHVGLDDLSFCTEENLSRFVNLKKVTMHANVNDYSWTVFPKPLLLDSIQDLNVLGVRVSDFAQLKLKKLKAVINALDFPIVLKRFPEIEELVLNI